MSTHPLHPDTIAIEDLTTHEVGDLSLWIGQQKKYHNVPNYVSNELSRRTSPLPSVLELLPSASVLSLSGLAFIWSDNKQPRYACCLFDSSQISLFRVIAPD